MNQDLSVFTFHCCRKVIESRKIHIMNDKIGSRLNVNKERSCKQAK